MVIMHIMNRKGSLFSQNNSFMGKVSCGFVVKNRESLLQFIKTGLPLLKNGIILKTTASQNAGYFSKIVCRMHRGMGVGAYGNDFTAQFAVAFQNGFCGIGMPQSVFKSTGVELNAFSFLN